MQDSESYPDAVTGCVVALERCASLVAAVPVAAYVARPSGQASMGAHVRHTLDHFTCFLRGLPAGVVDYDARAREVHVERDPDAARGVIASTCEGLAGLSEAMLEKALHVRQMAAPHRPQVTVASSVARELLFLSQHTIHHLALMLAVAGALGLELPSEFALAFSTASHQHGPPGAME